MPHVSHRKVSDEVLKRIVAEFTTTLLVLRDREMDARFLDEFFTETERLMFAKRFAMLALLEKGMPAQRVSEALKVSPSTVARFSVRLGKNRFPRIKEILDTSPALRGFWGDLLDLFSEGFSRNSKRRSRWMRDTLPRH